MRECDNSKIHASSNFIFSIRLLIMLDTLLLVPSLHCNTVAFLCILVGFALSQATKTLTESRVIALLYFRPVH